MQTKVPISFNEDESAYLLRFMPEGEKLTGENIKRYILRPFYDLPAAKKSGRPKKGNK